MDLESFKYKLVLHMEIDKEDLIGKEKKDHASDNHVPIDHQT